MNENFLSNEQLNEILEIINGSLKEKITFCHKTGKFKMSSFNVKSSRIDLNLDTYYGHIKFLIAFNNLE